MNKTQYAHSGNTVNLYSFDRVSEILEKDYYNIMVTPSGSFYLDKREKFDFPVKIYGKSTFPDRTLSTFKHLGKGMSVLLSGPKGTGKTVEAKLICENSGVPVITINTGYSGADFADFIESIQTPSCIFIDEFEKTYFNEENRNFFLTIMDGIAKSRHLFVLTSNQENIGEFFEGRPGRIRYHKKYGFLEDNLIEEILNDRLKNKNQKDEIFKQLVKIPQLSIDTLVCIIDECNFYDETPKDFLNFFNVSFERPNYYSIKIIGRKLFPKKGLSEQLLQSAKSICQYNSEYPDSNEFDKDLVEFRDCELTAEYSKPFGENYIEDSDITNKFPTLNVSAYAEGDEYATKFYWTSEKIKSFEESRKGFKAVHKDGSIMIGTPVQKSFGSFSF